MDKSASMSLTDDEKTRSDRTKALIRSELFEKISNVNLVEYCHFSDQLATLILQQLDSVNFNQNGTDVSAALKKLKEKNIDRYLKG
jgi:hypothetical protein